jgi:2-polyprenyl-6-methoxyphenol hydroxylase-like FAD-dependent oxidoreductase
MQHVEMCNALNRSALKAGVEIVRPVERIQVLPGAEPKVRFVHDAKLHEVTCRLVIGADGRGSAVAKQAGITLHKDPPHHLMSGLLVEGVEEWPEDTQAIGVEGDVVFYVFPQGGGRARLYLAYSREQSARFSGPDSAPRFLKAFHLSSVPGSDILARSRPAGPCHGYPNEDTWSDDPTAPGVVLIGDAAGHNDPTIGQGLSITFRDARLVSDIILNNRHLSQSSFRPYAEERHERMRRLRFVGRLYSTLRAEFGDEARARRRRAAERVAADPSVMLPFVAMFKGPEALPREAFEQSAWDRFIG